MKFTSRASDLANVEPLIAFFLGVLTLTLPDLPKARLNYPGSCMTPTDIQPANGARGCVLSFRLDHAISNQGMGVALPSLPQPGETTNAVLGETERAWLLIFAMLGFTAWVLVARQHNRSIEQGSADVVTQPVRV